MSNVFYQPNQQVSLATKHGKERAVSRPLRSGLGFRIVVTVQIETDAFGTFTGAFGTFTGEAEIHGCHRCDYKIKCAGNGDLTLAEPLYFPVCNP